MSEETLYCTKNDCYLAGQKLAGVDYLIVHSPAVYPTVIRAQFPHWRAVSRGR